MKTITLFSSLLLLCWVGSAFISSTERTSSEKTTLAEAIAQKWISVNAKSTGTYGAGSVTLEITNLQNSPLSVLIEPGTVFDVAPNDFQDMLVLEDHVVSLPAKQHRTTTLDAYCTNIRGKVPENQLPMTVHKWADQIKVNQLLPFIREKKFPAKVLQDVVWSITNNEPVNRISSTHPATSELKKKLFALTGQKETWYDAAQNDQVMPDRTINRETVSISGNLSFPGKKGNHITEELCNEHGTVLFTTNEFDVKHDTEEISYRFQIQVKGWKKGNYSVVIRTGTTVIKKYPFVV